MEKQSKLQYCSKTTSDHPLSKKHSDCLEKIHNITIEEGGKKSPFCDEIALNIDKIEKKRIIRTQYQSSKTMDITIGVKSGKLQKMVLIEYRLRYDEPKNLSKSEIDGKVLYSRTLVGNEVQIHNIYFFIFDPSIKNKAYYYLRKMYNNKQTHLAIDIFDLKKIFL